MRLAELLEQLLAARRRGQRVGRRRRPEPRAQRPPVIASWRVNGVALAQTRGSVRGCSPGVGLASLAR